MLEQYIAPRDLGSRAFRVLLVDASLDRGNNLLIKASQGEGYQLRVVRTPGGLRETLASPGVWDLVLHSCYLGDYSLPVQEYAKPLVEAYCAKRIRGVLCTSTITRDAEIFMRALRAAGVPCSYVPYSYQTPGKHQLVKFPEIKYFQGA